MVAVVVPALVFLVEEALAVVEEAIMVGDLEVAVKLVLGLVEEEHGVEAPAMGNREWQWGNNIGA